jgi:hypothetical protein
MLFAAYAQAKLEVTHTSRVFNAAKDSKNLKPSSQNVALTRDDVLRRLLKTLPKPLEKFASCKTRNLADAKFAKRESFLTEKIPSRIFPTEMKTKAAL